MLSVDQARDIKWAVEAVKLRARPYALYRGYYAGDQRVMMDEERLRTIFGRVFAKFRLNLCKPVVDSLVDRLQVQSFSVSGEANQDASDIWARNRLDRRAGQLHLQATAAGDAYLLVWPDASGKAVFYPQTGREMAVEYDKDEPGKIVKASKVWEDADKVRLNLYFPDRVEKYEASKKTGINPLPQDFRAHEADGEAWPLANEYGRVPVFHFANNADLGQYGVSELSDAVPVQDMMNYLVYNLLVGVEFQAFPQRYAVGVEVPRDNNGDPVNPFKAGPERVWVAGSNEGANPSMGQFPAADLNQVVNVKRDASLTMAQVTQTPPHYFMLSANSVSGESQKTAEQKLDAKVADRQIAFGDAWAEAMTFAVGIERGASTDGLSLQTNWKETKPRNEKESWEIAALKAARGVSDEQILTEMGYTNEQIEKMRAAAPVTRAVPSTLDAVLGRAGLT